MCIQNKTLTRQWNQTLTRNLAYLGLHTESKWVKTITFSCQEEKLRALITPMYKVNTIPLTGFLVAILWPHRPCYCDRYIIINTSTNFHLLWAKADSQKTTYLRNKNTWSHNGRLQSLMPSTNSFPGSSKMYAFLVSPRQKPSSRRLNTQGQTQYLVGEVGENCLIQV